MGAVLIASHPVHGERRFTIDDTANVGSAATNHLKLELPVEPFHARFLYRDGRLIATDLRTALGTFVQGRRIDNATVVRAGDTVGIGDWVIRIDDAGRPEKPFPARVDREAELIAALTKSPGDDALRQVYGDWLEENGHPKFAEVLSLEREIRDGEGRVDNAEQGRLGYRLRTLASEVPFAWRALVTRPKIENCHRDDCPRTWDKLAPTSTSPTARTCTACGSLVQLAETMDIARHAVAQNHRVAVDIALARYPRDLEVALARVPALATPQDAPVTSLPLFATDEPPGTVGALLASLHLDPPAALGRGSDMGFYSLPDDDEPGRPPLTLQIRSVSIRYDWDMYHEERKTRFSEIAHSGYERFSVTFRVDADLVENWLRARFGPPRVARQPIPLPDESPLEHRIYGQWLYFERDDGGCWLGWEKRLPDWALPPTDKNAALVFLNELTRLMRQADCTHEAIKAMASRPPPRSGIVVTGPLNRDDFWLEFEPRLPALEVAHALEVRDPVGTSGDVHMSSWSIEERYSSSRLGEPRYGNWVIEISLDGWPSGETVPDRYAARHLGVKDLARVLCIRPYRP